MDFVKDVVQHVVNSYDNPILYTSVILSVLLVTLCLCLYVFFVYRFISHRSFYNKSFNISLAVLPFFISTIILCLQSNIVVTLGTIGALAIIRFRTAIKDPVDMMYLLWSIHIGITCGCQLYEVAVLTSLLVTVLLLVLENVKLGGKPFIMVLHCESSDEKQVLEAIASNTKKYRIKSRNYTSHGIDFVFEISVKETALLATAVKEVGINKFSIIEYDSDDIL